MIDETEAPGWHALDTALRRVHGDAEPIHRAPAHSARFGGGDPLEGISAYRSEFGGRPHWHLVTFGYSELFDKEEDDPAVSGFGFEMTIRVVDPEFESGPPPWAFSLLQNLARYVFSTGNPFAPGHHSTLNGPIALERDTRLEAAAFAADPQLPVVTTPNGTVEFIQFVGITADEYEAIKAWDTGRMLALVATRDPALLTDLPRKSWLEDDALRRTASEGAAREGSSMETLFTTRGALTSSASGEVVLAVAANSLEDLKRTIRGRLEYGRSMSLVWPEGHARLEPGDATSALHMEGRVTGITLSSADRTAILEIPVARGDYPLPSARALIRVIPIDILDPARKHVVRVVG